MFSMPSASSLDVLARIGAAASPQHHQRATEVGGRRSPSESSAGGATTTVDPARSLYGGTSQVHNRSITATSTAGLPSAVAAETRLQQRARGQTFASSALAQSHMASRLAAASPAATVLLGSPAAASLLSASPAAGGLKIRSYTSKAADAMPAHEMVLATSGTSQF
jgi:hypothetical protein